MPVKKKDKVELRYYDIPQKEGVLALTGEEWVREYGQGVDYLHFHNLMEIGICRDGCGELVLDKKTELFRPGMISVIPRNYPHTTNSERGTKSYWEYLFLDPGTLLREHFGENAVTRRRFLELLGRDAIFGTFEQYPVLAADQGGFLCGPGQGTSYDDPVRDRTDHEVFR